MQRMEMPPALATLTDPLQAKTHAQQYPSALIRPIFIVHMHCFHEPPIMRIDIRDDIFEILASHITRARITLLHMRGQTAQIIEFSIVVPAEVSLRLGHTEWECTRMVGKHVE